MLGTLGAVLRTALVGVGFVVLFGGIVTLAYPPLLSGIAPGEDPAISQNGGSTAESTAAPAAETTGNGTPTETFEARGVGPSGAGAGAGVGPTLLVSLGGIVLGLTVISTGLAMPGQTSLSLLGEQPFTRRQRSFVLGGAFLMLGLPVIVWGIIQSGIQSIELVLGAGVLAILGSVLVLLGTAGGLKHEPRPPQNS